MTDTQRLALEFIADPDLATRTWKQVKKHLRLNPHEDVEGEHYCSVQYSAWIHARLARLVLDGDDEEIQKFIDKVDNQRLVRDERHL